jgi:hypothetical protein
MEKNNKPKSKASRSYSSRDIENWKFEDQKFPAEWQDHLGDVPERFLIYVDGDGGQGKTEYVMLMTKMLATYMGKSRLNNVEQGKHKQIKDSHWRNNFLNDIPKGKFQYDNIRDFDAYLARLRRPNSGRIQLIDSISYWPLTAKQIQELIKEFKNKSFVFVAYKKDFEKNKAIQHLCDIKVRVEHFIADTNGTSRFGGNKPFVIWEEEANRLRGIVQPKQ